MKLKLWNPKEKVLFYPDHHSDIEVSFNGGEMVIGKTYEYGSHEEFVQFVPLLYTGIKDMFGIPIFEGDVIEWENTIDNEMYGGDIKWVKEIVTFENGAFYPVCMMDEEKIEIIGNIYQNPELNNSI